MYGPLNVKLAINSSDLKFYSEQFTFLIPTNYWKPHSHSIHLQNKLLSKSVTK